MTQERFQYDYGDPRDAKKNAKRHKLSEQWAWVVQNPKTRRYVVLFGDDESDGPTRVKPLYTFEPDPVYLREYSEADRMNALFEMIERGALVLSVVNSGLKIEATSLDELCTCWIETGSIGYAGFEGAL